MRSHPGIIPGVQCVHPDGSGELGNTHTVIILSIPIKSGLFLRHSQAFPSETIFEINIHRCLVLYDSSHMESMHDKQQL